jgi:hypothetical protein
MNEFDHINRHLMGNIRKRIIDIEFLSLTPTYNRNYLSLYIKIYTCI